MAYETNIKRQSESLKESAHKAGIERSDTNLIINEAKKWWDGKSGAAFFREYEDLDDDAVRFLRRVESVVKGLERLGSLVERAENERLEKPK